MNDKKFIELLNLFVDREISSAEAAELEQEVARNPERRKVYQQYCRIHRGSVLLAKSYKSEGLPAGSKLAQAARSADEKVALFPERRSSGFGWAWASGLGVAAAAACVAFIVVRNDGSGPAAPVTGSPAIAQHVPATSSSLAVPATPRIERVATSSDGFKSTLVARALPNDLVTEGYATVKAPAPSLAWMDRVEMPSVRSVPVEELVFEAKPGLQQDPRTFLSDRPMQGKVEMTAFQFQK